MKENKIGDKSIKSPKTQEFLDIKNKILTFKEEHKKMKTLVSKKSISETTRLKNDIENLVLQIADFYDQKLSLNEELEMKDKVKNMSSDEILTIISNNPMLMKRPVLQGESFVLVGFKEDEWKKTLDIK